MQVLEVSSWKLELEGDKMIGSQKSDNSDN